MSAILKLVQGSPEWHDHRAKSRNASETPTVLGVSPWQTPYQLWLLRTGRAEQKVTLPMRRGTELEPTARAAYEALTGNIMQPLVLADGDYSASLDGITLDGGLVLEVKCPMQGSVPDCYGWQIEHQLMVSGAALAHLWVFDGTEGLLLEVSAQPERWPVIRDAWDRFTVFLGTDTPPPLTERDKRTREDPAWRDAAERYLAAKQQQASAAALEEVKAALLPLASHPSEAGCGVSVTQF